MPLARRVGEEYLPPALYAFTEFCAAEQLTNAFAVRTAMPSSDHVIKQTVPLEVYELLSEVAQTVNDEYIDS